MWSTSLALLFALSSFTMISEISVNYIKKINAKENREILITVIQFVNLGNGLCFRLLQFLDVQVITITILSQLFRRFQDIAVFV